MMMLNTILRIIMNEVFGNNYEDILINDVFSCECEDLGLGCCYFAAIQRRCLQNNFQLILKRKVIVSKQENHVRILRGIKRR